MGPLKILWLDTLWRIRGRLRRYVERHMGWKTCPCCGGTGQEHKFQHECYAKWGKEVPW